MHARFQVVGVLGLSIILSGCSSISEPLELPATESVVADIQPAESLDAAVVEDTPIVLEDVASIEPASEPVSEEPAVIAEEVVATRSEVLDPTVQLYTMQAAMAINNRVGPIDGFNPNMIVSDNVSDEYFESISRDMAEAEAFWKPYVGSLNYTIIVLTEKDLDWALEQHKKYGGDIDLRRLLSESDSDFCNWSIATGRPGNMLVYICTASNGINLQDAQTLPHEYYHLVQAEARSGQANFTPCWVLEGSATFFGSAIGFYGVSDYNSWSRLFVSRLSGQHELGYFEVYDIVKNGTTEDIVNKIILPAETGQGGSANHCAPAASYYVGAVATELLVGKYGVDKFIDMTLLDYSVVTDWDQSFYQLFGTSLEDFYTELAEYLREYTVPR